MQYPVPYPPLKRVRISISGVVQGVGFRPFVFRLANSLGLTGYVTNLPYGVLIEAEGGEEGLNELIMRLSCERPPLARISNLEVAYLDPIGFDTFSIEKSIEAGDTIPAIPPDIATCKECREEIFQPEGRRHLYPFTNCANCGPRLSIINSLPYDRPNTTMETFHMCDACRREYDSCEDRRFHAQPIACPDCGPHIELLTREGKILVEKNGAIDKAAELILDGKILAIKGIGGFLLVMDARNEKAVIELRERKRRDEKPFALLFPSLEMIREYCELSSLEEKLLTSPESPIVLLRKKGNTDIADAVAPANPYIGVMLPYSPLHIILSSSVKIPLIATSGNIADEPICIENKDALHRLAGIADFFLIHNRPITRYVDDSVTMAALGKEMMIRRARGYAPMPISHSKGLPKVMGVGAHLKNTIALSIGKGIIISQHIGDLETIEAREAFLETISDLTRLFNYKAEAVACDLHPDYFSTTWARYRNTLPVIPVQHHHSHIASCMMENGLDGHVLGVAWDGTGYGTDGTVWGGEFIIADYTAFQRVGHLKRFRLPGSDRSVNEPRRAALSVLFETFGEDALEINKIPTISAFKKEEMALMLKALKRGINAPITSSAGRLFDAVSSILGIRHKTSFEGQAAMELEFRASQRPLSTVSAHYDFFIEEGKEGEPMVIDWRPVISGIINDLYKGIDTGIISARFHNTLSKMILAMAKRIGMEQVALSGGVFQNRYLLEKTSHELKKGGFSVYTHQRVPPNDGGVSLGQVAVAGHIWRDR